MEFFETVDSRHSVRSFEKKKVDAKTIRKILDTVNLAPSAGNLQAYKIYVVRREKEDLMLACMGQESVALAPVVFVFCADKMRSESKYHERGYELYALQDATIAAAYCQLAAAALGLGSVWIGRFDPLEVSRLLNLGEHELPVAVIPIGYPAEKPKRNGRKDLRELVVEV
jgi:nitroreductase